MTLKIQFWRFLRPSQKTAINFSIDQGADFSKEFTVTTDGSTAYDISGLTLQSQMRKSYDSSSATATFTASVVTGSSGIYKLVLSNSTSASITAGRYVYDVEITGTSPVETLRVLEGLVTVTPEVTKA